jgi:hypothetical protein
MKGGTGLGVPGAGELEPAATGPGDRAPGGQEQGVRLHSPPSDSSGTQSSSSCNSY